MQSYIRNLVSAANEMFKVASKKKASKVEIASALCLGCEALSSLVEAPDFVEEIRRLANLKSGNQPEFNKITQDINHFVNHFLRFEKQLLSSDIVGLDPDLIEEVTSIANQLIEEIKNVDLLPLTVQRRFRECRDFICEISRIANTDVELDEFLKKIRIAALCLAGVVIVACNIPTVAASFSPAGLAVSAAVGNTVVQVGLFLIQE